MVVTFAASLVSVKKLVQCQTISTINIIRVFHVPCPPPPSSSSSTSHPFHKQDLQAGQRGPGLVTHWQQRQGLLTVAGPSPLVRVWDMGSEKLWTKWPVPPNCLVTALASKTDVPGQGGGVDGGVGGVCSSGSSGGGGGNSSSGGFRGGGLSGGSGVGGLMAAGLSNGDFMLYDTRERTELVKVCKGHDSRIVNLHFTEVGG